MGYLEVYKSWANDNFFDEDTRKELKCITSEKEIEDRFYKELEFGTGGLRGIMGAGTNRLNKYTVGKVTLGLGHYLMDSYGKDECIERGVVIGFDTRINSKEYARVVADVLTGLGLKVYLMKEARPTPQLSFSVPYYKALAGVVLTASHNPREYNGYKVYDEYGCQLVPSQADRVIQYVNEVNDYHSIDFEGNDTLLTFIDNTEEFVSEVYKQQRIKNEIIKNNLNVVYTPLHGSGRIPVSKILEMDGFHCVSLVDEQANDDGNFSTVKSPNPEDKEALTLGIELAKENGADLVIATDPDCDRVGVAVKTTTGDYALLTGNQIGGLLTDYIIEGLKEKGELKENSTLIKTIVTSEFGADIAKANNVEVLNVLTGFKFIGEKIKSFEENNNKKTYLFGYEESYGYLVGTHARDKDGVVASVLISEMAAYYYSKGMSLYEGLISLYEKYGFFKEKTISITLKGIEGLAKIKDIISYFRENEVSSMGDFKVIDMKDYSKGVDGLPKADVLKFFLEDGSWVAIRPSGTEPKLKFYIAVKGIDENEATNKLNNINKYIDATVNSLVIENKEAASKLYC